MFVSLYNVDNNEDFIPRHLFYQIADPLGITMN